MAYLQSQLIETLRNSTEDDVGWELRKSFLERNWSAQGTAEWRQELMDVSQCFVNMSLQRPHSYPPNIVQEAQRRSWGLQGNIATALSKLGVNSNNVQQPNLMNNMMNMINMAAAANIINNPQQMGFGGFNTVSSAGVPAVSYNTNNVSSAGVPAVSYNTNTASNLTNPYQASVGSYNNTNNWNTQQLQQKPQQNAFVTYPSAAVTTSNNKNKNIASQQKKFQEVPSPVPAPTQTPTQQQQQGSNNKWGGSSYYQGAGSTQTKTQVSSFPSSSTSYYYNQGQGGSGSAASSSAYDYNNQPGTGSTQTQGSSFQSQTHRNTPYQNDITNKMQPDSNSSRNTPYQNEIRNKMQPDSNASRITPYQNEIRNKMQPDNNTSRNTPYQNDMRNKVQPDSNARSTSRNNRSSSQRDNYNSRSSSREHTSNNYNNKGVEESYNRRSTSSDGRNAHSYQTQSRSSSNLNQQAYGQGQSQQMSASSYYYQSEQQEDMYPAPDQQQQGGNYPYQQEQDSVYSTPINNFNQQGMGKTSFSNNTNQMNDDDDDRNQEDNFLGKIDLSKHYKHAIVPENEFPKRMGGGNKAGMDTHAMCVIPAKKGHANKGYPKGKGLNNNPYNHAIIADMPPGLTKSAIRKRLKEQKRIKNRMKKIDKRAKKQRMENLSESFEPSSENLNQEDRPIVDFMNDPDANSSTAQVYEQFKSNVLDPPVPTGMTNKILDEIVARLPPVTKLSDLYGAPTRYPAFERVESQRSNSLMSKSGTETQDEDTTTTTTNSNSKKSISASTSSASSTTTTAVTTVSSGSGKNIDAATTSAATTSSDNTTTAASKVSVKEEIIPDMQKDDFSASPSSEGNLGDLVPILEMAQTYAGMDKASSAPYQTLQQCASVAKQKIKCNSSVRIKDDGSKELICHILANDIRLASVMLLPGTKPEEAKVKLATSVLETISKPHFRLISDGKDCPKMLQASDKPFETVKKSASTLKLSAQAQSSLKREVREAGSGSKVVVADGGALKKEVVGQSPSKSVSSSPVIDTVAKKVYKNMDELNCPSGINAEDPPFNSYVAWDKEQDRVIKKVRHLGHLYQCIPFHVLRLLILDHKPAIVQFLSNMSGIRIGVEHARQGDRHVYCARIGNWMELCTFERHGDEEVDDKEIAKEILAVITKKFIYHRRNIVYGTNSVMVVNAALRDTTSKMTCDAWFTNKFWTKTQKEVLDRAPIHFDDLSLLNPLHGDLSKLTVCAILGFTKKSPYKDPFNFQQEVSKSGKKSYGGYGVFRHKRRVIGGTCNTNTGKDNIKQEAGLNAVKNLQRCHYIVRAKKPPDDQKTCFAGDLMPLLLTEIPKGGKSGNVSNTKEPPLKQVNNSDTPLINADEAENRLGQSNVGYQMMKGMGWGGGGIGKGEDGRTEPVKAGRLNSKAGVGYELAKPNNYGKNLKELKDMKYDLKSIFKAYKRSLFHRPLWIPAADTSTRDKVYHLAKVFDMEVSRRGVRQNTRILIEKRLTRQEIFKNCILLGGRSDRYVYEPPKLIEWKLPSIPERLLAKGNNSDSAKVANANTYGDMIYKKIALAMGRTTPQLLKEGRLPMFTLKKMMKKQEGVEDCSVQCELLKGEPLKVFEPLVWNNKNQKSKTRLVYELENEEKEVGGEIEGDGELVEEEVIEMGEDVDYIDEEFIELDHVEEGENENEEGEGAEIEDVAVGYIDGEAEEIPESDDGTAVDEDGDEYDHSALVHLVEDDVMASRKKKDNKDEEEGSSLGMVMGGGKTTEDRERGRSCRQEGSKRTIVQQREQRERNTNTKSRGGKVEAYGSAAAATRGSGGRSDRIIGCRLSRGGGSSSGGSGRSRDRESGSDRDRKRGYGDDDDFAEHEGRRGRSRDTNSLRGQSDPKRRRR